MDTAIETINAVLCNFTALFFSEGAGYLQAFDPHQREALAAFALRLHEHGFGAGLLFFGFWLILTRSLILFGFNVDAWRKTNGTAQALASTPR